jgi:SAM-dependent methyltransferase
VVGVDLSSAVDVAFDRTRHLDNVLIVQGDMLRLPLRRAFDYAFSIGVLHHTADPRAGFLEMAAKVVPGGGVSAWVYGAENNGWVIRLLNPLRRMTSRLPRFLLLVLAHLAAVPLTLVIKTVYGPISRRPSLNWLRRRLFYFDYFAFLSQFGYREHAFIIFDHAVPAIAEYIPRDVFGEWFRAAGLERTVITDRAGNSWRGFGLVPG